MDPTLVILAVPLLVLLAVGGWWVAVYNRFARLRQHVRESWADIDVELRRRHDLVPNLVETVKGHAAHERELLAEVSRLRDAADRERRPGRLGPMEARLNGAVSALLARAEAYPDLKADRSFLELQRDLALTEDRLAAARRFYNANVRELNATAATFPASLVANAAGVTEAEYFEADESERAARGVAF